MYKLAVILLLLLDACVDLLSASRLPLVVFQHHHSHHYHVDNLFDDLGIHLGTTTTVSPDYGLEHNSRPLRVLYQIGVSNCTNNLLVQTHLSDNVRLSYITNIYYSVTSLLEYETVIRMINVAKSFIRRFSKYFVLPMFLYDFIQN